MCGRIWSSGFLLVGLFVLSATASNAQAIGNVVSVNPQAEGVQGSSAHTLAPGLEVHALETVRTGDSGAAGLKFRDNSNLSVGPKSAVRLDKFVYDPSRSTSSIAIEATRGSFRFVTGSQRGGSYKIKTPYGTLGVRG
jgi:hypothetical protein